MFKLNWLKYIMHKLHHTTPWNVFKIFHIFFWNKFYSLSKSEIISMLDFKFSCVFHLPISSPLLTVYDLISIYIILFPKAPTSKLSLFPRIQTSSPSPGCSFVLFCSFVPAAAFHFYYSSGRGTTPLSQTMQYMWTICMRFYWIS